ncbi:MAG: cyclic peptide export ABC transporter [Campylobacterota bacterium]|nr:cyclic peptide export ABC transporter [Campylobacterota bacterium]
MFISIGNFFQKEGDTSFWYGIVVVGTISAIANAGLLAIINSAAKATENEELNYYFFTLYIIIFLIFFLAKKFAILEATKEIEKILKDIRNRISHKIKKSELLTIEQLDSAKIFTRLTRDTSLVSQSATEMLATVQSLLMVFFALIYILLIAPIMFVLIVSTLIITLMVYAVFFKETQRDLAKSGVLEDEFFNSLNSTLSGFKELKVNSLKRDYIYRKHSMILQNLFTLRSDLSERFTAIMMFAETFLYILLGSIVFVIPHLILEDSTTIIQVTAAMLFIIGPIDNAIYIFPLATKTNIAIKNIYKLEKNLDHKLLSDQEEQEHHYFKEFKELKLQNLEFEYHDQQDEKLFGIGPVDLNIKRGEIIFIIGGNGSGKSTLMKTLLYLYPPSSGTIYLDNDLIDHHNYQSYRDLFSIILSDFYLFKEFYEVENLDYKLVNELLLKMGLNHKTKFINGQFTNINLSTGQRKRLALISAILEDKQIYLFDEWAADQDPEFREYFYKTVLPKLKDEGKTVIAVTHDEAYFNYCDRSFKMEDGKMKTYKGNL